MTEPAIDTFDNLKFNYFRRVFANGEKFNPVGPDRNKGVGRR